MKSRLIDAAAFVFGAILAFIQAGFTDGLPWPVRLALNPLCPGYIVGSPIFYLAGAIGLASFGFFFLISILTNGLIYGLASYLIRNALKGRRVARIALALGMGVWVIWGGVWMVQAWPRPEPIVPVDLKSPLAGRWTGVLHSPRGDRSVTLVCHPHTDSTLDGYFYVHGWDMGPFENGVYTRDSFHFEIIGSEYRAHFDSTSMAMVFSTGRISNAAELRFVSADTTRPPPATIDFATRPTGRWDGMLRLPSGDRAIILVYHPRSDGTLDGYFCSDSVNLGPLEDGDWAADSLHFRLGRIPYSAHFDSTAMALEWWIEGKSRSMDLRFAGADTSNPARPPRPNRYVQYSSPPSTSR